MPRKIDGLLDTNILIELWRGKPDSLKWLAAQAASKATLGLPVLAYMEMIDGVQSKHQQKLTIELLRSYPVVHLTREDSKWAQEQHAKFKLSHNIGIGDALIAAPAARLKVPIYTLNTKHFSPLPDVTAIRPY
jgi:predicted nucleic acid-binding protein